MSIVKMDLNSSNTERREYYDKLISKTSIQKETDIPIGSSVRTTYTVGNNRHPAIARKDNSGFYICKDLRDNISIQSKVMSAAKLAGRTINDITKKIQKKIKKTGESSVILSEEKQTEKFNQITNIKDLAVLSNGTVVRYSNLEIKYRKIFFNLIIDDIFGNQVDNYVIEYPSRTVIAPQGECFDTLFEDIKIMADRFALLVINMIEGKASKSAVFNQYKVERFHVPENVIFIQNKQFNRSKVLREVILNDSIKEIGYNAFSGCKCLDSIVGLENVESIDNQAFKGCTSLRNINIRSAMYLGNGVFYDCENLEQVQLSNSLEILSKELFKNTPKLKSIDLSTNILVVDDYAFYNSGLENIIFSNKLLEVGVEAFSSCVSLKSVVFMGSVGTIKRYAFLKCLNMSELYLKIKLMCYVREYF